MRNPFAVQDVEDPVGPDVEAFVKKLVVTADPTTDENSTAWVAIATREDGLEGAWSSRWRAGDDSWNQGVATLRLEGDRVHILYKDSSTYLIEAVRRGDRLVGRYLNIDQPDDTSPWIGVIITPYRIDGYWRQGRWDMRRCSPDERPEPIVAAVLTEARLLSPHELRELLGFARYLRWRNPRN